MSAESRPAPHAVVVLGKIVGAYGIKGWVRIHPFADDPLSWRAIKTWLLFPETTQPESAANLFERALKQLKQHADGLVAQFEGIDDRTAAEGLVGQLVGAPRSALPATATDEYYWGDLQGLDVRNTRGEWLGQVQDLMETGANTVLVVKDAEGTQRLLPFVASVVSKVDLEQREILVDWGLDW